MAEFCKKHAEELGFKADCYPMFCEGCGRYVQKPKSTLQKLFMKLINIPNPRSTKFWRGE